MPKLNALESAKQQELKHPKHQKDVLDAALEKKVLELLETGGKIKSSNRADQSKAQRG